MATEQDKKSKAVEQEAALPASSIAEIAAASAAAAVQAMRAPTPEQIEAAEKKKRDRELAQAQQAENIAKQKQEQERCPHIRQDGKSRFHLVSNYPDQMQRVICSFCNKFFEPTDPGYRDAYVEAHQNAAMQGF